MEPPHPPVQADDPCMPIQMDLSAMLDGELAPALVRRVMVHSDVCDSCRAFLRGIRDSARAHRELDAAAMLDSGAQHAEGVIEDLGGSGVSVPAEELRRRLLSSQRRLAQILYELGRGFVLMGVDPSFSRIVSREPVPVPDMFLRGRSLLDEVSRMSDEGLADAGQEWVRAQLLFDERELRSPEENLARGQRLLGEALQLCPEHLDARIYLGHAHQVAGDPDAAAGEFQQVLDQARDPVTRAFALENLGNLHLEQGDLEAAMELFRELVDSGVIEQEPRFYTSYFNLALAAGFCGDFAACEDWLGILSERFPHRRRALGHEFRRRERFAELLRAQPEVHRRLAERFPFWFVQLGEQG